jgi:hypothetical protein
LAETLVRSLTVWLVDWYCRGFVPGVEGLLAVWFGGVWFASCWGSEAIPVG